MWKSYAKINWSLRITGKRADGFHELETVFQTITLHDDLVFRDSDTLTLTCDDPTIPVDDTNLVIRAARAVGATAAIELRKRIPAGGGLGGGSSNAATTLRALGHGDLRDIALSLGSDVPFFLVGGTAYATGRGEKLTPIESMAGIPLLLVLPEERVSTREAFASITHYSEPLGRDAYRDFSAFTNDFEEPVFARISRLRQLKERLYASGARWAQMSGSGSALFGVYENAAARDEAAAAFEDVRVELAMTI
jgi:4-diphosphocytidyl-2-C-methyl-D-erythritol kinase